MLSLKSFISHLSQFTVNIGLTRTTDHSWIKQFNSLFVVLNEKHEVVTWKLTKKENFEMVQEMLENLWERPCSKDESVEFFIIDSCCKWTFLMLFNELRKRYLNSITFTRIVYMTCQMFSDPMMIPEKTRERSLLRTHPHYYVTSTDSVRSGNTSPIHNFLGILFCESPSKSK